MLCVVGGGARRANGGEPKAGQPEQCPASSVRGLASRRLMSVAAAAAAVVAAAAAAAAAAIITQRKRRSHSTLRRRVCRVSCRCDRGLTLASIAVVVDTSNRSRYVCVCATPLGVVVVVVIVTERRRFSKHLWPCLATTAFLFEDCFFGSWCSARRCGRQNVGGPGRGVPLGTRRLAPGVGRRRPFGLVVALVWHGATGWDAPSRSGQVGSTWRLTLTLADINSRLIGGRRGRLHCDVTRSGGRGVSVPMPIGRFDSCRHQDAPIYRFQWQRQ